VKRTRPRAAQPAESLRSDIDSHCGPTSARSRRRSFGYVEDKRGIRARLLIVNPRNKETQQAITNASMRIVLDEIVATCTVKSKLILGENRKIHNEFIRAIRFGDNSKRGSRLVMPMPPRNR
jgi:hypothetical protein